MPGNDSNAKLLLHCNGADASTIFTDESIGGAHGSGTAVGTAQVDTAIKQFGSGSMMLDGNSDYVTFPDSADFEFGSGDFTYDLLAYFNSGPDAGGHYVGAKWLATGNQREYVFGFYLIGADKKMYFGLSTDGTGAGITEGYSNAITISAGWHHYAWIRNGNTLTFAQDGVSVGALDITGLSIFAGTALFQIGSQQDSTHYFDGYIDELRISNIARWTSFPFTPPTSEYSSSSTMKVLGVQGPAKVDGVTSPGKVLGVA